MIKNNNKRVDFTFKYMFNFKILFTKRLFIKSLGVTCVFCLFFCGCCVFAQFWSQRFGAVGATWCRSNLAGRPEAPSVLREPSRNLSVLRRILRRIAKQNLDQYVCYDFKIGSNLWWKNKETFLSVFKSLSRTAFVGSFLVFLHCLR